jgi:hypothetical protein
MGFIDFLLGAPPQKPQIQAQASIGVPFYQDAYLAHSILLE